MPRLTPVSWKKLVECLARIGFEGPYQAGKHPYMILGAIRLTIPNPHDGEVSVDLLFRILRQAGISREGWLRISKK